MLEPKRRCKHGRLPDASPSVIPEITEFTISSRSISLAADHMYQRFEVKDGCIRECGLAKYQFIREREFVYSCGVMAW